MTYREATEIALKRCGLSDADIKSRIDISNTFIPGGKKFSNSEVRLKPGATIETVISAIEQGFKMVEKMSVNEKLKAQEWIDQTIASSTNGN